MKLLLIVLAACVLSSCRSLPNLSADEIHSRTSYIGVTVTADATGIKTTDSYVVAADATWGISFPGFDHVTTTKNYKQKRKTQ